MLICLEFDFNWKLSAFPKPSTCWTFYFIAFFTSISCGHLNIFLLKRAENGEFSVTAGCSTPGLIRQPFEFGAAVTFRCAERCSPLLTTAPHPVREFAETRKKPHTVLALFLLPLCCRGWRQQVGRSLHYPEASAGTALHSREEAVQQCRWP